MTGAELITKLKELQPGENLETCLTCMYGDCKNTESPCKDCVYAPVSGYSKYQPDMGLFEELEEFENGH